MTVYGFVYVLSNESMPGIYKIGCTTKHPRARMDELSGATACPTPFELKAFFGCENPNQVELEIHRILEHCRVNSSREFFRAPPEDILFAIRRFAEPSIDAYYGLALESEIESTYAMRARAERRVWLLNYFLSQSADPIEWPCGLE